MMREAVAITLLIGLLAACAPIGVATGVGAYAINAELANRSTAVILRDKLLYATIKTRLAGQDLTHVTTIFVEVFEGRVLLHGRVQDANTRQKIHNIIARIDGVAMVIDALVSNSDPSSLLDFGRDQALALELKRRLLLDKSVSALNYIVAASYQNIYILGIARNQQERMRVLWHADQIPNLVGVFDHVELQDAPARLARLERLQ
ncbi:MAG: BON domain-containing protein [Pseudomonadota bacterium]